MPQKTSAPNSKMLSQLKGSGPDVRRATGASSKSGSSSSCKTPSIQLPGEFQCLQVFYIMKIIPEYICIFVPRIFVPWNKNANIFWNYFHYVKYLKTQSDFVIFMDINRAYIAGIEHQNQSVMPSACTQKYLLWLTPLLICLHQIGLLFICNTNAVRAKRIL